MSKQIIKTFRSHFFIILLILLISLDYYFWFDIKNNLISIGGDLMIPLNPIANLKYIYSWADVNNGIAIVGSFHFIFILYALLEKLGLLLSASQFVHTYLIHAIGGLGMYLLANTIFTDHSRKKLIAFIATLLYIFTPSHFNMYFAYNSIAFIPLILGLYIRGLNSKYKLLYALGIGLSFFGGALPDPHPRPFILTLVPIMLYTFFEFTQLSKLRTTFIYFILVLTIIFLVNSWYFIGFFNNFLVSNNFSTTVDGVAIKFGEKFLDEGSATIERMFRLYHDGIMTSEEIAKMFSSRWYIIFFTYLFPLLAFGSIFFLFKKSKNLIKNILFLISLALFFILAAKGPNPPLDEIYKWLLLNVSGFKIFRTTAYLVLNAAIAYSLLAPFTVIELMRVIKNKVIATSLSLIIFIGFFYLTYPFLSGTPARMNRADPTKTGIVIPKDYYQLDEILNKDKLLSKTLILPLSNGYEGLKTSYYGMPMLPFIIEKPTIDSQLTALSNQGLGLQKIIEKQIDQEDSSASLTAGLSNIKYIVIHNLVGGNYTENLDQKIAKNFKIVKKLENVTLYEIDNNNFLPHFYIPNNIYVINKSAKRISDIIKSKYQSTQTAFFLRTQNVEHLDSDEFLKKDYILYPYTPILEYKRVNATKYRVIIHQAKGTFPLIFNEAYHDGWKLYLANYTQAYYGNINQNLKKYRIFESNEKNQATDEELKQFLQNHWVTSLGNNTTDFISKKINNSIQNNNLPNGALFETLSSKALEKPYNHLLVNSYANSWIIDTKKLCEKVNNCIKNIDGSYDMEFIIEYKPQQLMYVGIIISIITGVLIIEISGVQLILSIIYKRK